MIVEIVTRREFSDDEYWDWAFNTIQAINHIAEREMREMASVGGFFKLSTVSRDDFEKLLRDGEFTFEDELPWTKVKTTYRIIEK